MTVMPYLEISSRTVSADNASGQYTVAPASSAETQPALYEALCENGPNTQKWSFSLREQMAFQARAPPMERSWLNTAPLGSPVVPDVNMMSAMSSARRASARHVGHVHRVATGQKPRPGQFPVAAHRRIVAQNDDTLQIRQGLFLQHVGEVAAEKAADRHHEPDAGTSHDASDLRAAQPGVDGDKNGADPLDSNRRRHPLPAIGRPHDDAVALSRAQGQKAARDAARLGFELRETHLQAVIHQRRFIAPPTRRFRQQAGYGRHRWLAPRNAIAIFVQAAGRSRPAGARGRKIVLSSVNP